MRPTPPEPVVPSWVGYVITIMLFIVAFGIAMLTAKQVVDLFELWFTHV